MTQQFQRAARRCPVAARAAGAKPHREDRRAGRLAREALASGRPHPAAARPRARELMERAKAIDEGQQLQDDELAAARAELAKLPAGNRQEASRARRSPPEAQGPGAVVRPDSVRRPPRHAPPADLHRMHGTWASSCSPRESCFRRRISTGPWGRGNPLDAALRTVREHLQCPAARRGRALSAARRAPQRHRRLWRGPRGPQAIGTTNSATS